MSSNELNIKAINFMSINSKGILKKLHKHFKLKYAVNKVQTTYDMISSLNAWFSFQEGRPLDY